MFAGSVGAVLTARMDLSRLREAYEMAGLEEANLADDPVAQFQQWFAEVEAAGGVMVIAHPFRFLFNPAGLFTQNKLFEDPRTVPDTPEQAAEHPVFRMVHEVEVVRREMWQERMLRQFDAASWRSGLRAITGPQFASFDPATALIHFQALTLDRFRNVIDFLAEDAKAKGRSTPRVPAPLPVIGTLNVVYIDQMRLDLGLGQQPKESRT